MIALASVIGFRPQGVVASLGGLVKKLQGLKRKVHPPSASAALLIRIRTLQLEENQHDEQNHLQRCKVQPSF